MSEAGTLFKRYVWLIDTVQTGHWTKVQEILSHADDFEVLEPKWLCDDISRRVYNMYKYYSKEVT